MAKQSPPKNGPARIRFIMVDAEIPDGDLSQITTAIQNALKPTIITQRLPSPAQSAALAIEGTEAGNDTVFEEAVESDDPAPEAPRKVRPSKPRKYPSPKVIPLELSADLSLEDFVKLHTPKNERDKNLVAAAFLKEHRDQDEVGVNHIYTCYRHMNWSTSIDDFGSTLRSLKAEQLIDSPGRGLFTINHIGLSRVLKLGSE